jgi:hypothetical protein
MLISFPNSTLKKKHSIDVLSTIPFILVVVSRGLENNQNEARTSRVISRDDNPRETFIMC